MDVKFLVAIAALYVAMPVGQPDGQLVGQSVGQCQRVSRRMKCLKDALNHNVTVIYVLCIT